MISSTVIPGGMRPARMILSLPCSPVAPVQTQITVWIGRGRSPRSCWVANRLPCRWWGEDAYCRPWRPENALEEALPWWERSEDRSWQTVVSIQVTLMRPSDPPLGAISYTEEVHHA